MRKNFYDLLAERAFNPQREYATLWSLFCAEDCYYTTYSAKSMSEWVDMEVFRKLPFRGSFASLTEMMNEFNLKERSVVTLDKLFLFCELLYAVLPAHNIAYDADLFAQRRTIFENIDYILARTNHEWKKSSNGNTIIVEKNKAATLAAELVDDATIAFDIIEYNHFALKGHLAEKKKLLVSIAAHIEPILKSRALQNAGYKQLESDAGFVLNNFHIRHNNKEGAKAQDYIKTLSDNELEEWYDHAYELMLSIIIINDYLAVGKELADLKTKYNWKT